MPQVNFYYQQKIITCQSGETIQEVARQNGIQIFHGRGNTFNCKGLGFCKACRVRVLQPDSVSQKSFIEKIRLFRDLWRQSCSTKVYGDITVCTQGDFPTLQAKRETFQNEPVEEAASVEDQEIEVEEIIPEEVRILLDRSQGILLLDVRERMEFETARIEGATLIPLSELQSRIDELDREADIIVYCHHGMRSHAAAGYLLREGFNHVRNMSGGIDRWSMSVDTTVLRY